VHPLHGNVARSPAESALLLTDKGTVVGVGVLPLTFER
jgi:hypothetical protein